MFELFQLWVLVEGLGVLCLPLSFTLLHNLPDRGWAFSKILGMVMVAFCIWLPLMCIPGLSYSRWFIAGVTLLLGCGGGYAAWRMRAELMTFVKRNRSYVVIIELVFTGMMILLGLLRSFNPDIRGFEMFMDEGFVASIMRSQHFPPNDMWFSGYSINYYYYAHYTIATLARLLGQSPAVAFNTGISLFFGLTAVNLFGVSSNIVAWSRRYRKQARASLDSEAGVPGTAGAEKSELLASAPFGLISVLMGLILGNLAATQQWWQEHGNAGYQFNWFTPSRVIPNTINEFPAFSFLLSCFHAHVLTMAFTILCIALTFNWLLASDRKGLALFGSGWRLPCNLGLTAMILGGLFTMNGWDYPTYIGLTLVCIVLQQGLAYKARLHWSMLLNIGVVAVCLIGLSYVLYLPFYLHFNSPSQGIGLAAADSRSSLSDELLIYGLFAFVYLSLLIGSAVRRPLLVRTTVQAVAVGAVPAADMSTEAVLVGVSHTGQAAALNAVEGSGSSGSVHSVAGVGKRLSRLWAPLTVQAITGDHGDTVQSGGMPTQRLLSMRSWLVRGVLIGVGLILLAGLALLKFVPNDATLVVCIALALLGVLLLFYHSENRAYAFTLLCGAAAFTIIGGCEIFFLKDIFAGGGSQRMNTIFKFYFQAWALLSICSAAGLYHIWESFWPAHWKRPLLRGVQRGAVGIWGVFLLTLIAAEMVYPLAAPGVRYTHSDATHSQPYWSTHFSLDGMGYLATCVPPECDFATEGDYKAISWLNATIQGDPIIVEGLGDDYHYNGRVSTFTGLPTIMGWVGHEVQWRVNWLNAPNTNHQELFNRRSLDIEQIYTNPNPTIVRATMNTYHAQYLYVGPYEIQKYPDAHLERFVQFMNIVYQADGVIIYKVK